MLEDAPRPKTRGTAYGMPIYKGADYAKRLHEISQKLDTQSKKRSYYNKEKYMAVMKEAQDLGLEVEDQNLEYLKKEAIKSSSESKEEAKVPKESSGSN